MSKQTSAQQIQTKIGHAINDYKLIENGDKILFAVSGGKDSLTMLKLLKERQQWAPVKYDIYAVNIETDFSCGSCTPKDVLSRIFSEWAVPYEFANIKVLDENKKTNCFWCSWNRRKCLFEIADRLGCAKIALGHHKDDIIETTLLNILFQGSISTMNPKQELFKGQKTIIRPLCYVDEDLIIQFAKEQDFPGKLCLCPFGENSKRKYMKKLISDIQKKVPGTNIKTNIFKSIARVKEDYIGLKQPPSPLPEPQPKDNQAGTDIFLCN